MLHEKWSEYTVSEINAIKAEKCRRCDYGVSNWSGYVGNITCDYLLKTGERRNSRPEDCNIGGDLDANKEKNDVNRQT